MAETMKVAEFLSKSIDVDVTDDVCEELYIAFCGPIELTDAGKEHFSKALTLDITLDCDIAVVHVDGGEGEWQKNLKAAKALFESAAGYCAARNWDKWFKTAGTIEW